VGGGVPLPTGNTPSSPGEESGRGANFLFCDLKMRVFVNSEVLNLKFFFILSSLSEAWVESVANFGFSSKTTNKLHY